MGFCATHKMQGQILKCRTGPNPAERSCHEDSQSTIRNALISSLQNTLYAHQSRKEGDGRHRRGGGLGSRKLLSRLHFGCGAGRNYNSGLFISSRSQIPMTTNPAAPDWAMLKPVRVTDVRLNSIRDTPSRPSRANKSVQFTRQSIISHLSVLCGPGANRVLALDMDAEPADGRKMRTKSQPSTPADKVSDTRRYKSPSGWRLEDLQNCSVQLEQNVDPLKMIPLKIFNFGYPRLEKYAHGCSPPRISIYL